MAHSYEMFLRTIRTTSPREQEELWKLFLQRAYPHERTTMLMQILRFMDREDPEGLRATFREYKAEREAKRQTYSDVPRTSSDSQPRPSSSPSDSEQPSPRASSRRPYITPYGDAR